MNKPKTNRALLIECSDLRIELARSTVGIRQLAGIILNEFPLDDDRSSIAWTICLAAGIEPKELC